MLSLTCSLKLMFRKLHCGSGVEGRVLLLCTKIERAFVEFMKMVLTLFWYLIMLMKTG